MPIKKCFQNVILKIESDNIHLILPLYDRQSLKLLHKGRISIMTFSLSNRYGLRIISSNNDKA